MRLEVVYLRDGVETEQPPAGAERLAMAERYFSALLATAFPGARVRISRDEQAADNRALLAGAPGRAAD